MRAIGRLLTVIGRVFQGYLTFIEGYFDRGLQVIGRLLQGYWKDIGRIFTTVIGKILEGYLAHLSGGYLTAI